MALPHMIDRRRAPRSVDHHYFVQMGNETRKQRHWNSASCAQRSEEAYQERFVADTRLEKLAERRKKLAHLLHQENILYKTELMQTSSHGRVMCDMTDRIGYLKEQKEIQRKKVVDEKMRQYLRLNAPELRNLDSKLHKEEVLTGWETQRSQISQRHEEEREEKLAAAMEAERTAIRVEMEQKREAEERRVRALEQAASLRSQMETLRLREKESEILKSQEEAVESQQQDLYIMEQRRKQMEQKRNQIQFGRLLKAQALATLKRKSRHIQEELEIDLEILRNLAEKERETERAVTARREKARADATWMKQVVEEQLEVEKAREAELETLYQEEAARQWEKREAQWRKEAEARERLMQSILQGRSDQLAAKQEHLRNEQEQVIRERERMLEDLEYLDQETARETERGSRAREERKRELERQIREKMAAAEEDDAEARQHEEREREAAARYQQLVEQEARVMTQRGHVPRGTRRAWM